LVRERLKQLTVSARLINEEQGDEPDPETGTALVKAGVSAHLELPAAEAVLRLVDRASRAGLGIFIPRILGAPIRQAVGILTDLLGFARTDLLISYLARTKRRLEESGIEYENLPALDPAKLIPILESASTVTDESMKDRWEALLANALVAPDSVPPSFQTILSQLEPADAKILDYLFAKSTKGAAGGEVAGGINRYVIEREAGLAEGSFTPARLENLARLGLISRPTTATSLPGPGHTPVSIEDAAELSSFGADFVTACQPPSAMSAG
jgi:Abortive infection alpha